MAKIGNILLTGGKQLSTFVTNLSYNELLSLSRTDRYSLPKSTLVICALNSSTKDKPSEDTSYRLAVIDYEGNVAPITTFDGLGKGDLQYVEDPETGFTNLHIKLGNSFEIDKDGNIMLSNSDLSGNIYALIKVAEDSILSKVENNLEGKFSEVTQTAEMLKSVVADLSGGVESFIKQAADKIEAKVIDTANESYSQIQYTASQITSRVSDLSNEVYTEMKQTKDGIFTEMSNLETGLKANISSTVESMKSEYTRDINSIKNQIDGYDFDSFVTSAKYELGINGFGAELNGLSGRMLEISGRLDGLTTTIQGIDGIYTQIEQLDDRITSEVKGLSGYCSNLTLTAAGIKAEVNGLSGQCSDLALTADEIKAEVNGLSGQCSDLALAADEIKAEVKGLSGQCSDLTLTADGIKAEVKGLSGKYSSISQTVNRIELKVTGLSGKYSSISQAVDNINLSVSNLSATVAGIDINTEGVTVYGDKIDLTAGHTLNIKTGEMTVVTDGFKLKSDGSAEFKGNVAATSFQVNAVSGSLTSGTLLNGVMWITTYANAKQITGGEVDSFQGTENTPVFLIKDGTSFFVLNPLVLTNTNGVQYIFDNNQSVKSLLSKDQRVEEYTFEGDDKYTDIYSINIPLIKVYENSENTGTIKVQIDYETSIIDNTLFSDFFTDILSDNSKTECQKSECIWDELTKYYYKSIRCVNYNTSLRNQGIVKVQLILIRYEGTRYVRTTLYQYLYYNNKMDQVPVFKYCKYITDFKNNKVNECVSEYYLTLKFNSDGLLNEYGYITTGNNLVKTITANTTYFKYRSLYSFVQSKGQIGSSPYSPNDMYVKQDITLYIGNYNITAPPGGYIAITDLTLYDTHK